MEAERREYEAQSELEMCHSALLAAQQDKAHLEAELMEAAADVLEQQALQNACKEMQRAYQVRHNRFTFLPCDFAGPHTAGKTAYAVCSLKLKGEYISHTSNVS